jgi:hypothetical protein
MTFQLTANQVHFWKIFFFSTLVDKIGPLICKVSALNIPIFILCVFLGERDATDGPEPLGGGINIKAAAKLR